MLDGRVLLGAADHGDHVALANGVRRDVHFLAVDEKMAVPHELPGLRTRGRQAEAVDHVIQPLLQELQEGHAGDAARALGSLEIAPELIFEHAVDARHLLLFAQLQSVAGELRFPRLAVLPRREVALFDGALLRVTPLPFEEQLHRLAATQTTDRTNVPCHYTRLRLGGLHPLCGIGVTSRIDFTSRPTVCSARIADSRPDPGPLTRTSSDRMPTVFAALPALSAACVAANGVPLRDPLKPIPPALDHATTLPSVSVIVTVVLLNDAWMCASPWWTMRFSPRFLKVFLRFPATPSFFSGVAPSGVAASAFAITEPRRLQWAVRSGQGRNCPLPAAYCSLHNFFLSNRALARTLPRARIGSGALAAYRQAAAVAHPPEAADFHQPLDVHRHFLAQVALDAALLFDDPADLPHVVLGQILDAHVGAHPGVLQDAVRSDAADAENVGQTDLHSLGSREINAGNTRHTLNLEVGSAQCAVKQNCPLPAAHCSLPLSLFVFLIRTNDPHDAAAPNDLAFVANPLYRCSDFHNILVVRSVPCAVGRLPAAAAHCPLQFLYNPPARDVLRHLNPHAIADKHADEVAIHPIGDVRRHDAAFVEPHAIQRARQCRRDDAGDRGHARLAARSYRHLARRQHARPIRRHRHRVLEVRRQAAVARHRGPAVGQHLHRRLSGVHHRLDREHHALSQPRSTPRLAVIGHLRVFVHALTDPVADELANDRKAVGLDVPLHLVPDVRHAAAGPRPLDCPIQRFLGDTQQPSRLLGHLAHRQRHRAVAVVAVERRADVDRNHVALVQHAPARGNAVDHFVVDRRANRRRVSVIALERRRRSRLRNALLGQPIQISRGP